MNVRDRHWQRSIACSPNKANGDPTHSSTRNRVRVLIVQRIVPPYRRELFEALGNSTHFEVAVAYGDSHSGSALRSVAVQAPSYRLNNHVIAQKSRELLIFQTGIRRAIRSWKPSVLVLEFNIRVISNLLLWLHAKLFGIRVVWWGHGFGKKGGAIARALRLALARRAVALIVYDTAQRNELVALGVPPDRVLVAHNSIDTRRISSLAAPWCASKRHRIVVIGRLLPEKKVDLVVRAFAAVSARLPADTILTIIGEGPEFDRLAQLAQRLSVTQKVHFPGAIYNEEELSKLFNESFVSVSAGYVGLGIVHSFAYGVPMLVARDEAHSPEIAALVDGQNGLLFASDDVLALADALAALATSPDRLQQMSASALHTISARYSLASMVATFETALALRAL